MNLGIIFSVEFIENSEIVPELNLQVCNVDNITTGLEIAVNLSPLQNSGYNFSPSNVAFGTALVRTRPNHTSVEFGTALVRTYRHHKKSHREDYRFWPTGIVLPFSQAKIMFYDTLADFPTTATQDDLAVANDTNIMYRYDINVHEWVPFETGGGGEYTQTFAKTDWVAVSNTWYTILITHDLNNLIPLVDIYSGADMVGVDTVEIVDANSLKIYVPFLPDGRFNGSISIK